MSRRHYGRATSARINSLTLVVTSIVLGFLLGSQLQRALVPCLSASDDDEDDGTGLQTSMRLGEKLQSAEASVNRAPPLSNFQTLSVEDSGGAREHNRSRGLVLVGVMTAKKYIDTRVVSAYETWAKTIPGRVVFFSSAGSESVDVPIVGLPGVDDSYPPQKKSFMMLKYMHDHFLDDYEFFMRADDDVYIRGDKLASLLYSVNSSKALFIGQAGLGNKEEFGLLNLQSHENFCMGGPGMVFSRATLAAVVPHVSYCLKNLYTSHEDVEVGRCVQKFASVSCTWAFEMQRLFYNNYKEPNGSFSHSLKSKEVHRAITLHPIKNHTHQYRMHHYFHSRMAVSLRQQVLGLSREVHAVNEVLQDRDDFYSPNKLGLPPSLLKSVPKTRDEVLPWDYISRYIYSLKSSNPKRGLELSLRRGLEDIVTQVMEMINKNARQRGRTIDFKEVLYGYHRVNPLHGANYVLDLLLVYRKHKGKRKMTVPVRRHAYLEQTFTKTEFREDEFVSSFPTGTDSSDRDINLFSQSHSGNPHFLDAIQQKLGKLYGSAHTESSRGVQVHKRATAPVIHFLLPLAGRFETFLQFMHNFEEVCLKQTDPVVLVVILFHSDHEDHVEDTVSFVEDLQGKYRTHSLRVLQLQGPFSRGRALMEGSALFSDDSLLFFIDVDIYLRTDVLWRIRWNSVQGEQVYYPIVFSQYDPKMACDSEECPEKKSRPFNIGDNLGYWRQFGFGIAAMYKSDFKAVGGFDTSIQGWGKEDVDLYETFIKLNFTVFRAVDPGLVHIFHPVTCDPALDAAQYQMCLGSKAATLGSTRRLADMAYNTPEILYKNEPSAEQDGEQDQAEDQNDVPLNSMH